MRHQRGSLGSPRQPGDEGAVQPRRLDDEGAAMQVEDDAARTGCLFGGSIEPTRRAVLERHDLPQSAGLVVKERAVQACGPTSPLSCSVSRNRRIAGAKTSRTTRLRMRVIGICLP